MPSTAVQNTNTALLAANTTVNVQASCPNGYSLNILNNNRRCLVQAPQCYIESTVVKIGGGASASANVSYNATTDIAQGGRGGGGGGTVVCPPCPNGGASAILSMQGSNTDSINMCVLPAIN